MLLSTEFYITIQRYINNLSNLAMSTGICLRTLSVPRCENRDLWGTDNVQGQIPVHIFAQNRDSCVFYPWNILQRTWKIFMNSLLNWMTKGGNEELITASSFKFLKAGNMSRIVGLDSKSLTQNHSWTSLSILNNWNSIHIYFG